MQKNNQNLAKPCFKIRFWKLKNKTCRANEKLKCWYNAEEGCASSLKGLQLRRMKQGQSFRQDYGNLQRIRRRNS